MPTPAPAPAPAPPPANTPPPPTPPPASPPTPPPRRRLLKRAFSIFIRGLCLLLLLSIATLFIITRDISPSDTTDLETPPPLNTSTENFNTAFIRLLDHLPDDTKDLLAAARNEDEKRSSTEEEKAKKKEDAIAYLTARCSDPKFRTLFLKAANAERGVVVWALSPLDGELAPSLKIEKIIWLAQIIPIHVLEIARRGNPEAAVEEALDLLRLAHKMAESNSSPFGARISASICDRALDCLNDIVEKYTLPEKILRKTIVEIGKTKLMEEILRNAIRSEFSGMARFIRTADIASSVEAIPNWSTPQEGEIEKTTFCLKFFYQRNRTLAVFEEHARRIIALTYSADRLEKIQDLKDFACGKTDDLPVFEKIRNSGGFLIVVHLLPVYTGFIDRLCGTDSKVSLTQAHLAIRMYRAAHSGALPENLRQLVVEGFLDAVPKDYLTGEPIRYSKELGFVWVRTLDEDFNLRTTVQREGFAQDFEANAVCVFPTRTLRCVERKAQAAVRGKEGFGKWRRGEEEGGEGRIYGG